ncbi:MAG: hypothetical protein KGZ42_11145 [Melioribacter sp.]|nr:hypothetical protein [Melioribacter sp.]
MKLIRKYLVIISLLTIFIQFSIIFPSIVHFHTWHYLKIFSNQFIDSRDKHSHHDPFSDESGICRINDYVRNNYSATLTEKADQFRFDYHSIDLEFSFTDNYQYSLCNSFRLRGPPSS